MKNQNIENEVKFKIKSVTEVKKKVLSQGFLFGGESYQEDHYFSPFHKNFAGTKKYYLRLRNKNDKCIFAYHIVKNNLQTKEFEVGIDSFDIFYNIMKLLDFKIDCIVKKNRLTYKKNDIKIMIDSVEKLGNFIEIEYCGRFTKKIKNKFSNLIKIFNLKNKDLIKGMGYPDLLMNKKL